MKKMQCSNCGGRINPRTYRCEYCGTQYRDEIDQVVRVETYTNPIRVYKSQMMVNDYEMNAVGHEEIARFAVNNLARNLADAIAENMEVETTYDPRLMSHRMTAKIRIVEPKYLF